MIRLIITLAIIWFILNILLSLIVYMLRHQNYNYCSNRWENAIEDKDDNKYGAEEACKKWADRCHEVQEHSNSFTCISKVKAIIWHIEFYNKIVA